MATATFPDFIGTHREELIARCIAKVATRTAPKPPAAVISFGVPLFLDQLVAELRDGGRLQTGAIAKGATMHGADLRAQGLTIAQVVHDYGDICQAVTDLAVEMAAPIETDDFRTLNRCLDDAIASAVTEYSRDPSVHADEVTVETRSLVRMALSAWRAIKTGRVGAQGATGDVLDRTLATLGARFATPSPSPPNYKP